MTFFFRGSCQEVRALLDSGEAFGVITATEHAQAEALAHRVCAMLFRPRQRAL